MTGAANPHTEWLDLAFAIAGGPLPRDHRQDLATALDRALPWLFNVAGVSVRLVHLVPMAAGDQGQWLLSGRSRLQLRVPGQHRSAASALQGLQISLGGASLHVGPMRARELRPWHTLHAQLVATEVDDEAAFMHEVDEELVARGVPGRPICGRRQELEQGSLQGYSLMVDGLSPDDSMRLLQQGLGRHRRLGCGVFDAHRSTAAVGATAW